LIFKSGFKGGQGFGIILFHAETNAQAVQHIDVARIQPQGIAEFIDGTVDVTGIITAVATDVEAYGVKTGTAAGPHEEGMRQRLAGIFDNLGRRVFQARKGRQADGQGQFRRGIDLLLELLGDRQRRSHIFFRENAPEDVAGHHPPPGVVGGARFVDGLGHLETQRLPSVAVIFVPVGRRIDAQGDGGEQAAAAPFSAARAP
jgi:hypothetical protein